MSLEGMVCPKCGGQIQFEEDQDYVFCSHCGTQIFKDSDNKKSFTYREINETRLKELEYEERAALRKEKNTKLALIVGGVLLIIFIIAEIVLYATKGKTAALGLGVAVFSAIMWGSIIIPDLKKKKE